MTNFEKTIEAKFPCDCEAVPGAPGYDLHSKTCAKVLIDQVFLEMKKETIKIFIMSQSGYSDFIAEPNESNSA